MRLYKHGKSAVLLKSIMSSIAFTSERATLGGLSPVGYYAMPSFFPGGGVLPYMGYISMCGPKGYGFSAALVTNRESILAILVINRVRFLLSS